MSYPKSGLQYNYIELDKVINKTKYIHSFKKTSIGAVSSFVFPGIELTDQFGLIINGYVKVPKKGIYTFSTNTNDGNMLYVQGKLVVNNDGDHGARERVGQVALKLGYRLIKLEYFQMGGGKLLEVFMEGPEVEKHQLILDELFY